MAYLTRLHLGGTVVSCVDDLEKVQRKSHTEFVSDEVGCLTIYRNLLNSVPFVCV